jgi:DNA-binding transcriptional ArsR family regulator
LSYSPSRLCISAALAAALPSGGELWWYVRALDRHGSGRVMFTLDDAAEALQMSKPTVYRWFSECRKAGLLQLLKRSGGVYVVAYQSVVKAAMQWGVSDLGSAGYIPMKLARSLRYLITDMQAEENQSKASYAAMKAQESFMNPQQIEDSLVRPIFEPTHSCFSWSGAKRMVGIEWVGKKTVFVRQDYALSGGSQGAIADYLGVTSQTISRRLSSSVRGKQVYGKDRGIELVERRQIARQDISVSPELANLNLSDVAIAYGPDAAQDLARYFECSGRVWRSECNLYWFRDLDLHPKRQWRSALSKALNPEKKTPVIGVFPKAHKKRMPFGR